MATAYPGGLRKRGGLLDEFMAPDYSYLARRAELTPKQREYAANAPIDFLRGTFAGLLGAPADVANIPQSPMPMEQFGEYSYAPAQKIPYGSEYFLKNLPLAPAEDNPLGRVAGQVGSFAPMVPVQAARMAGKGVMATGRFVAPKAGLLAENYMQRMGTMPSIVPAESGGLLGPSMPAMPAMPVMPIKPVAEVSPSGFYSAVEQQALNIPRKSGTGASFLNDLMKGQDVKKYEIEAMGLDQFLSGKPNVTRQEVQDFIQSNRVNVQEKQLGGAITEDPVGIAQRKAVFDKYEPQIQALYKDIDSFGYNTPREVAQSTDNRLRKLQEMRDAEANAYYKIPEPTPTQYEKFQLPGGENYREILLTLPKQSPTTNDIATRLFGKEMRFLSEAEKDAVVVEARKIEDTTPKDYVAPHFNEPNLLTHLRVNDRIDADGKKMLLVEEVQSDWHQAGREQGYRTKERKITQEEKQELKKLNAIDPNDRTGQMNERLDELDSLIAGESQGVPDAPFKDTWYQLALKRAIKEAVDKGYDRIGLTTGAQQASRYDLSKQIDKIDYRRSSNNTFELGVVGKDGESVDLPKRFYTAEELPSVLGKEVAEKIVKGEGQGGGGRMTLSGLDLQVGGEGMKKYYDEIYPNFLNKYGKKYGAQVKETQIPTEDNAWNMAEQIKKRGITDAQWRAFSEEDKLKLWNEIKKIEGKKQEPVRYLDITPEMRKAVQKGQPLASIGSIDTGLLA